MASHQAHNLKFPVRVWAALLETASHCQQEDEWFPKNPKSKTLDDEKAILLTNICVPGWDLAPSQATEKEPPMTGRNYFFSTFAIVLLTLGITYVVDPGAIIGLLIGIGRVLFGIGLAIGFLALMTGIAFFLGPVEE